LPQINKIGSFLAKTVSFFATSNLPWETVYPGNTN
jgi:hypothetical protein